MSVGNIEDIVGAGGDGIGSALDPTTGALPVQRVDDPRFDDLSNPVFVVETNKAVGTYYYPDAAGQSNLGYRTLAYVGEVIAIGDTWVITVEASNDGTKWDDVTGQFLDGSGSQPPAAISITGGTVHFSISINHFDFRLFRMKIVISGTVTTNSALIGSYQKAI